MEVLVALGRDRPPASGASARRVQQREAGASRRGDRQDHPPAAGPALRGLHRPDAVAREGHPRRFREHEVQGGRTPRKSSGEGVAVHRREDEALPYVALLPRGDGSFEGDKLHPRDRGEPWGPRAGDVGDVQGGKARSAPGGRNVASFKEVWGMPVEGGNFYTKGLQPGNVVVLDADGAKEGKIRLW